MLNLVISNVILASRKETICAPKGGTADNAEGTPFTQDVSSLLEPSGHVVLDRTAEDKSTNPYKPFKLASVRSAFSIEPDWKLTIIVFSKFAPVKSAPDKSVSNNNDSLRLTLDMSAPERFV